MSIGITCQRYFLCELVWRSLQLTVKPIIYIGVNQQLNKIGDFLRFSSKKKKKKKNRTILMVPESQWLWKRKIPKILARASSFNFFYTISPILKGLGENGKIMVFFCIFWPQIMFTLKIHYAQSIHVAGNRYVKLGCILHVIMHEINQNI